MDTGYSDLYLKFPCFTKFKLILSVSFNCLYKRVLICYFIFDLIIILIKF